MRALFKNPTDEKFHTVVVPNKLEVLQELVGGGSIEAYTFAPDACVICNEEGRIKGMDPNCKFKGEYFVGPILIVGIDGEEFTDCPMAVTEANKEIRK